MPPDDGESSDNCTIGSCFNKGKVNQTWSENEEDGLEDFILLVSGSEVVIASREIRARSENFSAEN
jgi:hypothetical protein